MNELDDVLRRLEQEIKEKEKNASESRKQIEALLLKNKVLQKDLGDQKQINQKLLDEIHRVKALYIENEGELHARSILQSILESSIEYSIVALDLKGIILFWNKGAEYNYGYTSEEVVKKHTVNLLHSPEDIASGKVQAFLDKAYKKEKAEGVFERVRKDNTHFIASVHISLRRNELGVPIGYVIISKNITESKLIEEQLLKTNQELEQFAYIASHDLKAPLRAIERLATWIEEDNKDKLDQQSKENLALLRQRTIRMTNLIDGILQYSRAGKTDLELQVTDTKELLQEVVDSINPGKRFRIQYGDNLPTFTAAKLPLSQVFSNLIVNSIKYHDKKRGTIKIGVIDLRNYYKFYVKDDGPGIDPQYFDKIFMIFQTLRPRDEYEATGIGLSIVKKIVESQNGKVSVTSTEGEGTTFYFTWPKFPRSH